MSDSILRRARDLCLKEGFDAWELYFQDKVSRFVRVVDDRLAADMTSREAGLGIRASKGGGGGYASTGDLSERSLRETAERLGSSLLPPGFAASPLPDRDLSRPAGFHPRACPSPGQLDMADLAGQVVQVLQEEPGDGAEAQCRQSTSTIAVWNHAGTEVSFSQSRGSLMAIPGRGTGGVGASAARFGRRVDRLDAEAVAVEARRDGNRDRASRPPDKGRCRVVLSPGATATLTAEAASLLGGKAVRSGRSVWADSKGEAVGSATVTLLDDPWMAEGYGSCPWDAEGVATRPLMLVDGGILKGFAHTWAATEAGDKTTGNATREDYAQPPRLGFHNLRLKGSDKGLVEVLAEAGEGLYLTGIRPSSSAGPGGAGPYQAEGFLIQGGRLAGWAGAVAILDSLPRLFLKVILVAGDSRTFPGGVAGSAVLLEDVEIR